MAGSQSQRISESSELHKFNDFGLKILFLDFKLSKKTDEYGNEFKYRAKVKDTKDAQLGRWAWNVLARFRGLRPTNWRNKNRSL
jgi:hypothetical protein